MNRLGSLESAENRCRGWLNNRVMALSLMIESNRPRDPWALLKHQFFLEEIEHHFMRCDADRRVWNAFRYLKRYLRTYPASKSRHVRRAIVMIDRIYGALGLKKRISIDHKAEETPGSPRQLSRYEDLLEAAVC